MTTHSHLDATTKTWHKPDEPRAFTLKFNQSKLKSANPVRRQEYQEWKEVEVILFTSGSVCLDRSFMNYYPTLTDLCDSFGTIGKYEIEWHEGDEQEHAE